MHRKAASRLEEPHQSRKERMVIFHPMQDGVGVDQIRGFVRLPVLGIGLKPLDR